MRNTHRGKQSKKELSKMTIVSLMDEDLLNQQLIQPYLKKIAKFFFLLMFEPCGHLSDRRQGPFLNLTGDMGPKSTTDMQNQNFLDYL